MKRSAILLMILLSSIHIFAQKKKTQPKATTARADSIFLAGNYKDAVVVYESALKDPATAKEVRSWFRLGASWAVLNHHEKAITAFDRALQINARQPGLRLAMAKSYAALDNNDKAIAMLDSALATGFANFKSLDADPQLENVRKDPRYSSLHDRMLATAYPCLALPEARMLDFWIGDWNVFPTANLTVQAGTSKVTKRSQGCVIFEDWHATGPHEGVSINYFDPVSRKWKQKWAGASQDITEFEGEFAGNALVYLANSIGRNGQPLKTRMTFTDLAPGKVRQHGEQSNDEGKTWATTFDFTYIRKSDGATP